MIVVADSGPLYYLILLEHIDLLRRFYGHVLVPEPVAMNCPLPAHQPSCGSESRTGPPGSMRRVPPVAVSTITDDLDLGERAAIRAMRLSATRSFFPPAPFQGGLPMSFFRPIRSGSAITPGACEGSSETASIRRWRACSCTRPAQCQKTPRVQRGQEVQLRRFSTGDWTR